MPPRHSHDSRARHGAVGLTLLWLVCTLGGCATEVTQVDSLEYGEGEVGLATQALQLAGFAGGGVRVVEGPMLRAPTAAVRGRDVEPGAPHGSCGSTFVSPHYAITAGHCVDKLRLGETVELEEIEISTLNWIELLDYVSVSGTWPEWSVGRLTTGYEVTSYDCELRRLCYGAQNGDCPLANTDVDLALLWCPQRQRSTFAVTTDALTPWGTPTYIDEIVRLPVDVWWYHEVYDLPIEEEQTDYWTHYGLKRAYKDNWHYQKKHQLLPLLSAGSPAGGTYLSNGLRGDLVTIDTPGCHGTSGSGVFLDGFNLLLGVVSTFGPDVPPGVLCDRTDLPSGGDHMRYVRARDTAAFVKNATEVYQDR